MDKDDLLGRIKFLEEAVMFFKNNLIWKYILEELEPLKQKSDFESRNNNTSVGMARAVGVKSIIESLENIPLWAEKDLHELQERYSKPEGEGLPDEIKG